MPSPKKGVAYTFDVSLLSTASPGDFQVNPTIAAGDFKLSKDGGTFTNLTNLPTVTPTGDTQVVIILTATEMTADRLTVKGLDQAGGEWGPYVKSFDTTALTVDDVPDAVLLRDWTAIGVTVPAYCLLNAGRFLRNAWALVAGSPARVHVKTEDGTTDAWVRDVTTNPAGEPITGVL